MVASHDDELHNAVLRMKSRRAANLILALLVITCTLSLLRPVPDYTSDLPEQQQKYRIISPASPDRLEVSAAFAPAAVLATHKSASKRPSARQARTDSSRAHASASEKLAAVSLKSLEDTPALPALSRSPPSPPPPPSPSPSPPPPSPKPVHISEVTAEIDDLLQGTTALAAAQVASPATRSGGSSSRSSRSSSRSHRGAATATAPQRTDAPEKPQQPLPETELQHVTQHIVFKNGGVAMVDGKQTNLIYSHMAMIEMLPDGRLVAAWQGSAVIEGAQDQRIYMSFSIDEDGREWGLPQSMPDALREAGQWSPVLHVDVFGLLWLFYAETSVACLRKPIRRKGQTPMPQRWAVGGSIKAVTRGIDGRWSTPRILYTREADSGIPKVVANKMTILSTGEWLLPFWRQRSFQICETENVLNSVGVLVSRDKGSTWNPYGSLHLPQKDHWVIEGTLVETGNGNVMMLLRSSEGFIYHSVSKDKGRNWAALRATSLPNPDSKIHGIRLLGGDMALCYNDHARTFTGMQKGRGEQKRRDKLMVSISRNEGSTWFPVARLDADAPRDLEKHMLFHYPTLLQRGNTLFIAYSRTYLDRNNAPPLAKDINGQPVPAADGIFIAKINLDLSVASILANKSRAVPLFDKNACKTTNCLITHGIAG
ncbi:hypothetical protein CYMTET_34407 [Cymbomonas tetramitiformis]|uniref:Sialidase domain-containing protein n=1 Tax=Cymbomonas tetramitiformis TaxID=36881 RepID=A0AAE0KPZ5_9CHLO|nr:hypothetical protein CYMTET_34407 [Cymbomonas tetramitiformis]